MSRQREANGEPEREQITSESMLNLCLDIIRKCKCKSQVRAALSMINEYVTASENLQAKRQERDYKRLQLNQMSNFLAESNEALAQNDRNTMYSLLEDDLELSQKHKQNRKLLFEPERCYKSVLKFPERTRKDGEKVEKYLNQQFAKEEEKGAETSENLNHLINGLDSFEFDHIVNKPSKYIFTDQAADGLITFDSMYGQLSKLNHGSFQFANHKTFIMGDDIYSFSEQPFAVYLHKNVKSAQLGNQAPSHRKRLAFFD